MGNIDHIVVVMLENRSFDDVLGWLYADQGNRPPLNLPDTGAAPTYDGLVEGRYWNPSNASFFSGAPPQKVFATRGTTGPRPFNVPTVDPNELFPHITAQLFGTSNPAPGQEPSMLGFLVDYQSAFKDGGDPARANPLMECYAPEQLSVLNGLARSYAVCDRWFASVPAQTWPNRSFVHAGTSAGHVNNWPLTPFDVKTLYQVLEENQVSWGIYTQRPIPLFGSFARLQLKQLRNWAFNRRFHGFEIFRQQAADGTLPEYAFVEPSLWNAPISSGHPPEDMRFAEAFLLDLYQTLRSGRDWDSTLLVITFDEHGGCYDHVPPPGNAVPPDAESDPGEAGFRFDRFGVRVPTILVSPYIEPGTVFRSPTDVPYDHTSILRTLRDWKGLPDDMLPSERIRRAPSFAQVLTRSQARTDTPDLRPAGTLAKAGPPREPPDRPLNDLERSLVAAVEDHLQGVENSPTRAALLQQVRTRDEARRYLEHVTVLGREPPGEHPSSV